MTSNSLGRVSGQIFESKETFKFISGGELPSLTIAYETYGELNEKKDNAILVCHALSGHQHAAGINSLQVGDIEIADEVGWWDVMIGPGKAIDTNKYFVLSINNPGGCHGSTGPSSINPQTNKPYANKFPRVRVEDWVAAQKLLAKYLGIECFHAVIGGSIGGMQALSWSISYPEMLKLAVIIAGTPKLTTQNIAFNEIARQSIKRDPAFANGDFYNQESPKKGLSVARMLGHVTYLSDKDMQRKFGRDKQEKSDTFQIESYLKYNGDKFAERFDANTYLIMTEALDDYDPAETTNGDLVKALAPALAKFLIVSFKTDWRFPKERSQELVTALLNANKFVSYAELAAQGGHDAFLQDDPTYHSIVAGFLNKHK